MTLPSEADPLLIRHSEAMRRLGIGPSKYWASIREKKIQTVGERRMARAYYPSIKAYVDQMLAEAQARDGLPKGPRPRQAA